MVIREATQEDWLTIWPIFRAVAAAGETYAFDRGICAEEARQLWMVQPRRTFVAEEAGAIVGTYYLKTNQQGPGAHVCNCGYIVAEAARGRGIAAALCEHSQALARELGYRAMQFNFVASSNAGAIRLWQRLGFVVVGTLPGAFHHPNLGFIDALIMYKWLDRASLAGRSPP